MQNQLYTQLWKPIILLFFSLGLIVLFLYKIKYIDIKSEDVIITETPTIPSTDQIKLPASSAEIVRASSLRFTIYPGVKTIFFQIFPRADSVPPVDDKRDYTIMEAVGSNGRKIESGITLQKLSHSLIIRIEDPESLESHLIDDFFDSDENFVNITLIMENKTLSIYKNLIKIVELQLSGQIGSLPIHEFFPPNFNIYNYCEFKDALNESQVQILNKKYI